METCIRLAQLMALPGPVFMVVRGPGHAGFPASSSTRSAAIMNTMDIAALMSPINSRFPM